jgi:hypothetical protein
MGAMTAEQFSRHEETALRASGFTKLPRRSGRNCKYASTNIQRGRTVSDGVSGLLT